MSWTQVGANYATMLGSLSVITAVAVWVRKQWLGFQRERNEKRLRNWHGSIDVGAINTWFVRLAEEPTEPTAMVILEVVDSDGEPFVSGAYNLRQVISSDGRLSRSPTTEELEFLKHLRAEHGYAKSPIVR
jgi:hypothetical protein